MADERAQPCVRPCAARSRHPSTVRNVYTLDDPASNPAPDQVSIHMPGQAY